MTRRNDGGIQERPSELEEMLEDVRWLINVLTEETLARIESLKGLLEYAMSAAELENMVETLTAQLNTHQSLLMKAEEESRVQEREMQYIRRQLEELQTKLAAERERYQREISIISSQRDQYETEVSQLQAELKRRDEVLVNVSGIKKSLRRIAQTLQGKSDDSSMTN